MPSSSRWFSFNQPGARTIPYSPSAKSNAATASAAFFAIVVVTSRAAEFCSTTCSTDVPEASVINRPKASLVRASIDLNSKVSNHFCSAGKSGLGTDSNTLMPIGASRLSTMIFALRVTRSRLACSDSFNLGVCASAASKIASSVPYWLISFAAVFSPTPGTPSRLSLGSPRKAA